MSKTTPKDPGLNLQVLEEATGGDRDLMRELAALYLSDADLQIRAIEDALQCKDVERVRRISHNIVIASEGIGAVAAGDAFRRLEETVATGSAEQLEAAFETARDEFDRVRRSMAELR
jgi:HPt (histidine-containing phosphotransfer) domain-containing protein